MKSCHAASGLPVSDDCGVKVAENRISRTLDPLDQEKSAELHTKQIFFLTMYRLTYNVSSTYIAVYYIYCCILLYVVVYYCILLSQGV